MFFSAISTIIFIINFIIVVSLIYFQKKDSTAVLLWSVVLIMLPIVGFLLYIFFGNGPTFGKRKKFLNKHKNDIRFVKNYKKQAKKACDNIKNTSSKELMTFNTINSEAICTFYNDAEIYSDIQKLYDDIFSNIKSAKKYVNIQSFIIRDDKIGNKLIDLLTEKVREKVVVRVVYDDVGCIALPKDFFEKLTLAGGQVCAFFPSKFKYLNRNINYRNHRKIIVIDGNVAYVGGANIGEEYLGKDKNITPFIDCHLKIMGEAVLDLNLRFIQDFSFASKGVLDENQVLQMSEKSSKVQKNTDKLSKILPIQMISDGPDSEGGRIVHAYIKAIYSAKKSIYIQTPYLILDEAFFMALSIAVKSGVDVVIMIPETADKSYVYYATLSNAAELIKQGVKVYKRKGFLHSKTLLIDHCISSIGTFNLDIRSFYLQFEITAFIYDKEFNKKLLAIMEKDLRESVLLDRLYLSRRTYKQKFLERTMRLLAPVM